MLSWFCEIYAHAIQHCDKILMNNNTPCIILRNLNCVFINCILSISFFFFFKVKYNTNLANGKNARILFLFSLFSYFSVYIVSNYACHGRNSWYQTGEAKNHKPNRSKPSNQLSRFLTASANCSVREIRRINPRSARPAEQSLRRSLNPLKYLSCPSGVIIALMNRYIHIYYMYDERRSVCGYIHICNTDLQIIMRITHELCAISLTCAIPAGSHVDAMLWATSV